MRPPRCQTCPRRIKASRKGFLRHCYDCRSEQAKAFRKAQPKPEDDPVKIDAAFDAARADIQRRRRAA